MTLSDQEQTSLLSFVGYGSPSAPLWFIGAEEGLGGALSDDEEEHNLHARGQWREFMDLCEAHMTLKEAGKPIDVTKKRKGSVAVWLWMSRIARAYEGREDWPDRERAREYVQRWLGRPNGITFLTEISPVPERKTGAPKWLVDLRSGDLAETLLAQRETRIRELLRANKPRLVVCYGLGKRMEFARLLGVDHWIEVASGVRKAPGDAIFLLPFFGQGQISRDLVNRLMSCWSPSAATQAQPELR